VRDFGTQSFKIVQRVHKAWESPLRKDRELRGIRNGIIGEDLGASVMASSEVIMNGQEFIHEG